MLWLNEIAVLWQKSQMTHIVALLLGFAAVAGKDKSLVNHADGRDPAP